MGIFARETTADRANRRIGHATGRMQETGRRAAVQARHHGQRAADQSMHMMHYTGDQIRQHPWTFTAVLTAIVVAVGLGFLYGRRSG